VIEGKFFARIAIIIEDQSQGRRNMKGKGLERLAPSVCLEIEAEAAPSKIPWIMYYFSPTSYRILDLPTALWSH
jgi:hypothetical protein